MAGRLDRFIIIQLIKNKNKVVEMGIMGIRDNDYRSLEESQNISR